MTPIDDVRYLHEFFKTKSSKELMWKLKELNHKLVVEGNMVELVEIKK